MTGDRGPNPVRAVIFDLDGVLVDSEPLLYEAERVALAAYGAELTPAIKEPFIGLGARDVLAALARRFDLDVDLDELGARKMAAYLDLVPRVTGFAPTTGLARALQAEGVPLAIASGSTPEAIDAALGAIGLRDAFPVRVSTQEVASGKPAPDVFLLAAWRLDVDPGACLVVEDAVPGVRAARAAGMRCIAIPSVTDPLDAAFAEADLLVPGGTAQAEAGTLLDWVRAAAGVIGPGPLHVPGRATPPVW